MSMTADIVTMQTQHNQSPQRIIQRQLFNRSCAPSVFCFITDLEGDRN